MFRWVSIESSKNLRPEPTLPGLLSTSINIDRLISFSSGPLFGCAFTWMVNSISDARSDIVMLELLDFHIFISFLSF